MLLKLPETLLIDGYILLQDAGIHLYIKIYDFQS